MTIRERTKALRERIERGDMLTIEEAVSACVTLNEALGVFSGEPRFDGGDVYPICCGVEIKCEGGFFGMVARCPKCKAEIRDALGPMSSPFLERGNSFVTVPSEEFVKMFGDRYWIAMHEGER
jgi:hypothetical protein